MGCSSSENALKTKIDKNPLNLNKIFEKNLCKIKINNNEEYGTGFFTKIKFKNNIIFCLISNNNVITKKTLNKGYIDVTINDIYKKIEINKKIWKNEELDYIILEIDKDEDIDLLEIDDNCYNIEVTKNKFNKNLIINASFNSNQKIEINKGILDYIDENEKFYFNSYGNETIVSGGPILLNNNFKIIGLNYRYDENKKMNLGIYMNDIIKDINKYNIIEGILDIKDDLLFQSSSEIKVEEIKLYIKNEEVNITKKGKEYIFDINELKSKKYEFKIYFKNIIKNIYFLYCENLYSIDLTYFDTSNIANMSGMFAECSELIEIKGINKFNTSKVNDMSGMFQKCSKLTNLDLTNFNTSNVTDMQCMFNFCSELKEIKGLNKFDTSKVTNMQAMFQGCYKLMELDVTNFDTSNVTDMAWMFNYCQEIKEIKGINNFNTGKVINIQAIFQGCKKLIELDVTNFDISNITDMNRMFNFCHVLKEIKGIEKFNTSKVKDMQYLFNECKNLINLDLTNFNTLNVINMNRMFNECHELKEIRGLNNFNTSKVNIMKAIFSECNKLLNLDLTNFDTSNVTDMEGVFNGCKELKEIKGLNNFKTSNVITMAIMFQNCNNLLSLDLTSFDTSNVSTMGWMFNECHELKEIKGLNKFDTSKVTKMNSMFQECNKLLEIDVASFDTSNVTDMGWIFNRCYLIKEIKGINNLNTFNVINMHGMFQECNNLINLDLTNFNTSNVVDMNRMFTNCFELKEIKGINNFNTSKVIDMFAMFSDCKKLINLDLTNFNTENVNNMEYMFHRCLILEHLTMNFILNDSCNLNNIFKDLNASCVINTNNNYLKSLFVN